MEERRCFDCSHKYQTEDGDKICPHCKSEWTEVIRYIEDDSGAELTAEAL